MVLVHHLLLAENEGDFVYNFFFATIVDNLFDKGSVTYRYLYAMRHNDALGWGTGGVIIANVVLKMRKVIKFRSS